LIDSIGLKNFKCFSNVEVQIGALTVLSGLNGMGKSSLLQSLLLLRQSRPSSPLAQPRARLTLNGQLAKLGTASDVMYEEADDDKITLAVTFRDSGKTTWSFQYDNPDANVLSGELEPKNLRHLTEPLFRSGCFHYLQAERTGPRTFYPASEFDVVRRRELGSRGEHTAYFLAINGEKNILLKSLAHPKAASLALRDQVEAWMGELSPGTRIHITPYKDIDLVSLRYSFVESDHVTNPYRSTNVGFGLTYTLPVIVALLSSPPGRSLILLENPEAHLHPRGQSRLGEFLAKAAEAGAQIIAETHSDHILNGIRVAARKAIIDPSEVKLHFLERRRDGDHISCDVKTPQMDRDGRLDYWPEGFFDEWDKNLEALLDSSDR
jgi:predicted ATPase